MQKRSLGPEPDGFRFVIHFCYPTQFAVPATSSHSKRCRRAKLRYFDYVNGGGGVGDEKDAIGDDDTRVRPYLAPPPLNNVPKSVRM